MMRSEALIGRRRDKPLIEMHQLMQIGRPAPPMANDEHWRLLDLSRLNLPPIPEALGHPHHGIERCDQADQESHRPADRMYAKAVLRAELPPHKRPHSMPEPRRIPRVWIGVQLRRLRCWWGRLLVRQAHSHISQILVPL